MTESSDHQDLPPDLESFGEPAFDALPPPLKQFYEFNDSWGFMTHAALLPLWDAPGRFSNGVDHRIPAGEHHLCFLGSIHTPPLISTAPNQSGERTCFLAEGDPPLWKPMDASLEDLLLTIALREIANIGAVIQLGDTGNSRFALEESRRFREQLGRAEAIATTDPGNARRFFSGCGEATPSKKWEDDFWIHDEAGILWRGSQTDRQALTLRGFRIFPRMF